jgi:hypothetical protein
MRCRMPLALAPVARRIQAGPQWVPPGPKPSQPMPAAFGTTDSWSRQWECCLVRHGHADCAVWEIKRIPGLEARPHPAMARAGSVASQTTAWAAAPSQLAARLSEPLLPSSHLTSFPLVSASSTLSRSIFLPTCVPPRSPLLFPHFPTALLPCHVPPPPTSAAAYHAAHR